MRIFKDLQAWRHVRVSELGTSSIGFVPTMGALHQGHVSLLERARRESDIVVLSIFVNPTQFNNPNDLATYPSTLEADLRLAEKSGVDFVLLPDNEQVYPDSYRYKVSESEFSRELCGAHRPGHFDGVLTVVMRLFNLVQPHRAYFGEKDYQQLLLIKGMAESFFMNLEIVPCPTVREADGLAMSSRNVRITANGREKARIFPRILNSATSSATAQSLLEQEGFLVDYVVDKENRRFGAVTIDGVRLIDNVELK